MLARFSYCLLVLIFLFSCKNSDSDVALETQSIVFNRIDLAIQNPISKSQLDSMLATHPAFFDLYFHEVLGLSKSGNDTLLSQLNEIQADTTFANIFKEVNKKYSNMEDIKKELASLYGKIQKYFPNRTKIPSFYPFISDFQYQLFIFEVNDTLDGVGIGLDMFLYPEIKYKDLFPNLPQFSDYLTKYWNKQNIVPKIADLNITDIMGELPGHRLLDQMIYNGKSLYLKKLLLPDVQDSILLEYTGNQVKWLEENEQNMWSFFLDQNLFYEANPTKISKYINPSPDSPNMPNEAPGRTANYMGWQIVKAYMKNFPDTSLEELIALQDSQLFLEKSKYKPKR